MHHIVVCGLPTLHHFSTLSHKRYDLFFSIVQQKRVFWFFLQFLSETFFILRRIEQDIIKNVYWFSCKVPLFLLDFKKNLHFLDRFSENNQYQIS